MPSSLASTLAGTPVAASASSTVLAAWASIGASGRPTVKRELAQRRLAAGQRGDRHVAQVAGEQQRPADRGHGGTPAAEAIASASSPAWAPWRTSPEMMPRSSRCSSAVAAPNSSLHAAPAGGPATRCR